MTKLLAKAVARPTLSLVAIFIALDGLALLCAWLFTIDLLESRFFKLGRDRGFGEIFEYGKFALIIYMLLELWRSSGEPVLKAWAILFSVMLADNLIGIHEEIGELLIIWFDVPDLGLRRPKDVAEIIALATVEGSVCLYVAWSYFKSGPDGHRLSHQLCFVFAIFVFSALVLDAVGPRILEESGEILGMTLILAWLHSNFTNVRTGCAQLAQQAL